MPHRLLPMLEPIVNHGLRELATGATPQHTLTQIALMAALVGTGQAPQQAIRFVEQHEAALIGLDPRSPAERAETMYHPGLGKPFQKTAPWQTAAPFQTGFQFQKPTQTGYGAQLPTTAFPFGYAPTGKASF